MRIFTFLFFAFIGFSTCTPHHQKAATTAPHSKAEQIVQQALTAHGGEKYETAQYEFVFRENKYTFKNDHDRFTYSVIRMKGEEKIYDVLSNEGFVRTSNGKVIDLSEKDINKYTQALNSVIYFATLPHKLKDKAVNKKYLGETIIKDKPYHIIEITFNEEGGGKDHDDTFLYWINKESNIIDFLAYNYKTNNGGVRFRSAYNPRRVGGILFQDYVNYKAEVGTPLKDLPGQWEQDELKKLSVIEISSVQLIR